MTSAGRPALRAGLVIVMTALACFAGDPASADPGAGGGASAEIRLQPDDPRAVAGGGALYATHCAACHGAALEGQPNWRRRLPNGRLPAPPHDPSGHTHHHPDEELFRLTREGTAAVVGGGYESDMPGYAGILTDQEIIDVLSYIKSRWPDHVRERHDRLNDAWGASRR